jgi:hypothetical protein
VPDAPHLSRMIRVLLRAEWTGPASQGLLASDPRMRTLRRVLVTYPDVRHILPDRISLEDTTDRSIIDTLQHFLERQHWLVKAVVIE